MFKNGNAASANNASSGLVNTSTTTTALTAEPTLGPTATETETATTAAPPEGTQLVVTIRDGEPAGGIVRVTVHKGDLVLIKVRSDDVADEVHVHGYDRRADVAPGKPVEMLLRANLTGDPDARSDA